MNALLDIPQLIYTLLIQLACGIALACQFAPGERGFLKQQALFAFTFLFLAPLLRVIMEHSVSPAVSRWEMYCIGALGAGLIADFWLKYEPDARPFERILGWLLTGAAIALLFCASLPYDAADSPELGTATTFFLSLGSAMLLGSIWVAMAGSRQSRETGLPLPDNAFFSRLLFLGCSGFVLTAIFTPLALPLQLSPRQILPATPESIADWHAWHCGLSGFAILTFLVAVYRTHLLAGARDKGEDIIPGLPSMGFAFILALLGEAVGRVAFLTAWMPV
ncbi:MAG: hypothetical protein HDQ91_04165 [Desulfovibrio sp.]|nr:hypothetical protein [Desulfovibrio sp.]